MNNEEKKIIGYDPQTGQPIYEETQPQSIPQEPQTQPIPQEPKKKNNTALIFIIIGGVLLFLVIVTVIVLFSLGLIFTSKTTQGGKVEIVDEEKTFYGESYNIKYKYPWAETKAKLTSGKEEKILSYKDGQIRLLPIGSSDLSKTATTDFSTSTGKFKLYNDFREYWGKTDNISNGTGTFLTLTDKIYYASMDYTRSDTHGKMYIIVSQENNIVLSFSLITMFI